MSIETIRDYFLTAGASFRNSDVWRREFETDDTPRSRVLRSGRFGVGVLAGFLLGSRLEISTRHIRSSIGVRFGTMLDLNPIELRYDSSLRVGTTIRVLVSSSVYQRLIETGERTSHPDRWSWYIYEFPTVARYIGRERKQLRARYSILRPDPTRTSTLRQVRIAQDYTVYWTYRELPLLSVNGIFVTQSGRRSSFPDRDSSAKDDGFDVRIEHPRICVEDPDGKFPLNLRRSDITEQRYPFESTLLTDVIDDFLAYLLVRCPKEKTARPWSDIGIHPGVRLGTSYATGQYSEVYMKCPVLVGPNGFSLLSRQMLSAINTSSVSFLVPEVRLRSNHGTFLEEVHATDYGALILSPRSSSMFALATPSIASDWSFLESDVAYLIALEAARLFRTGQIGGTGRRREQRNLYSVLPANRPIAGVRLILPRRIETKLTTPNEWGDQIKGTIQHREAVILSLVRKNWTQ